MALALLAHSIAIALLPLAADDRYQRSKYQLQAGWSGEEFKEIGIFAKLSRSTETIDQTINQTATSNQKLKANDVRPDWENRN